jgi:hypothetical protein
MKSLALYQVGGSTFLAAGMLVTKKVTGLLREPDTGHFSSQLIKP